MDHMQRRRPTIAKEWQLAVLKKLQSESSNPTERQRLAAAAETGLDEKWVRNWFTRQRSKVSARNRKCQSATAEQRQPRVHSATVPTFRLQLDYPFAVSNDPQGSPRSVSMPVDPGLPTTTCRESSPGVGSRSPLSWSTPSAIPHSCRSVSVPMCLNPSPRGPTPIGHSYSRDPLCDRYPDFSQFFHPQVHERFRSSEFSSSIGNYDYPSHLLANPDTGSHVPMRFQDLFDPLDPLHLGDLTQPPASLYLRSCPVAFSMRLVDLLGPH